MRFALIDGKDKTVTMSLEWSTYIRGREVDNGLVARNKVTENWVAIVYFSNCDIEVYKAEYDATATDDERISAGGPIYSGRDEDAAVEKFMVVANTLRY